MTVSVGARDALERWRKGHSGVGPWRARPELAFGSAGPSFWARSINLKLRRSDVWHWRGRAKVLSFLAGVGLGLVLPLGGNLTLAEFLLLGWGGVVFASGGAKAHWPALAVVIAALLGLSAVSLIAGDVFIGDPFALVYKTWVRFGITFLLFVAIVTLCTSAPFSDRLFFIGSIPGVYLAWVLHADYVTATDPWKYNLGAWVGLGGVALLRRRRLTLMIALVLFAYLNAVMSFRTLVFVSLCTDVILLMQLGLRSMRRAGSLRWRLGGAGLCALVILGGADVFNQLAIGGVFGGALRGKQAAQVQAAGGLAETSRPEFMIDLEAVKKSPIAPWGSNPKDPDLAAEMIRKSEGSAVNAFLATADREEVPTHSVLFDAWIRSGVFGFLAWTAILLVCVCYIDGFVAGSVGDPSRLFAAVLTIWNIIFSPVSPQYRITLAVVVGALVVELFGEKASRIRGRRRGAAAGSMRLAALRRRA